MTTHGHPHHSALPETPTPSRPQWQPLKWAFPFAPAGGSSADPQTWLKALAETDGGFFPLGSNGMYHGGIHFDAGSAGALKQGDGVGAIADGEVVAYRLDSTYPELTYPTTPARYALYSTGFVLVRHSLALPPAPQPAASPTGASGTSAPNATGAPGPQTYQTPTDEVLEFYSLYMHQLDWKGYQHTIQTSDDGTPAASAIHPLPFWKGDRGFLVGAKATDRQDELSHASAPFRFDTETAASRTNALGDGALIGRIATGTTTESFDTSSQYRDQVRYTVPSTSPTDAPHNAELPKTGIQICDRASGKVIGLLPRGGELRVIGNVTKGWALIATITKGTPVAAVAGAKPDPRATTGWVNLDKLDAIIDPKPLDTVVVLDTPFKVSAGDVIGYLGEYQNSDVASLLPPKLIRPLLHVEVFTGAHIIDFIGKSRDRAKKLPDSGKTLLVIQPGAKLVEPTQSQNNPQLAGATLLLTKGDPGKGWWAKVQPTRITQASAEGHGHGHSHHTSGTPIGGPLWVERKYAGKVASANVQTWADFPLQLANAKAPANEFHRVLSRTQLDQLSAFCMATDDQDKGGTRWWSIEAGGIDGRTILGWVCEKDHPLTLWESPWAWPGFDTVDTTAIPLIDMYRRNLFEARQLFDGEEKEFSPIAATVNAGPFIGKLEMATKRQSDGRGNVKPSDLRRALTVPWLAGAISHLIFRCESEWGGDMSKWETLSRLMGNGKHVWQTELERIKKLQWWDAMRAVRRFPDSPDVWHIHPIGLVGNFIEASVCISLSKAQLLALTISSGFEGNHPMDYAATAGNFDGMGMSYGLIQWNAGSGTLAPILSSMRSADPAAFTAAFPPASNLTLLESAITSGNRGDLYNWAINQQSKHPNDWKTPFKNLANIQAFRDIQLNTAVNERHRHVMTMIEFLRSMSPDLMKQVELVSYCALFDVAIQQQSIAPAAEAIKSRVTSDNPTTQFALVRIAVEERAKAAKHVYVADCMSRRIGILQQSPYSFSAYGQTSRRTNSNFNLIAQDAHTYVCQI